MKRNEKEEKKKKDSNNNAKKKRLQRQQNKTLQRRKKKPTKRLSFINIEGEEQRGGRDKGVRGGGSKSAGCNPFMFS